MSQQTGNSTSNPRRGIVKQVLSGDVLIIRGQPRNGPPPERTLALSGITAPKLARRANPNVEGSQDSKDEPFAWEAREYLRKLLVGKEVSFTVEYVTNSKREYGIAKVKRNDEEVSIIDLLLSEGFAEVRQTGRESEETQRLNTLEATAKAAGKGKWSKETKPVSRDITWSMTNEALQTFVQRHTGKEIDAVIEHVRDGSTVRAILIPSFTIVTVIMSGIKCPTFKRDGDKETPEPFAEQAKFFTECRLLQQDVKLLIEGVSNQLVLATIIHPAGNIAESLLKQGYARCVDWSMASVTRGKDKLRAAEKKAKQEQLRLWKGYTPSAAPDYAGKSKNFTGKVVEVGHADNIIVKTTDGNIHKVYFSSLRPPRAAAKEENGEGAAPSGGKTRPLYDVPYMFEAREFLRKKLIGKKVNVVVDYVKPAQDRFPEKVCCTVTTVVGDKANGVNIAEALISKGLAYCLRHRQDDDQRSSTYDELLTAEARAAKNGKGVHSKKESPIHRVADVSQDTTKAKQFLPFLQRAGRTIALVEFVASGSRARLYLPKDTCLINFILAGLSCPRAPNQRDGPGSGEPFGQEALFFTKELIMQREIEVEVETVDKGGNFIGAIFVDGKNLAVLLLEAGLSKVFVPSAERSQHGRLLFEAEEVAKKAKKKIWEDYVEPAAEESAEDEEAAVSGGGREESAPAERQINHRKIIITEVVSLNHFWAQFTEQGPQFNTLMEQLRKDLTANPPLPGSYTPTKGALCVAKFSDGLWYRAKIERMDAKNAHILYIDFGNKQVVPTASLGPLPAGYRSQPPQAQEFFLACVIPPDDEDWLRDAYSVFCQEVNDKTLLMNTEYKVTGQSYVSILNSDDQSDIAKKIISEGLARVDKRKDRKLAKLVGDYCKAEEEARRSRAGMWEYGDITPDTASEFGYKK